MSVPLPLPLRTSLESGDIVLFVGSGIGNHARNAAGDPAPTGQTLAAELAKHFSISVEDEPELTKVAQIVVIRKGRAELQQFLAERLKGLEPDDTLKWLFSLTWRAIFTTNYDRVIQRCYEIAESPTQTPITITQTPELRSFDPRFNVPVYHLHGSLFMGERPNPLITQEDYGTFREQRDMLFAELKYAYATTPILYVGYSNQDPNWQLVTGEIREEFLPSEPPGSYRVAPSTSAIESEILLHTYNIESLPISLEEFRSLVVASVGELRVEPYRLDEIRKGVPADLHPAFEDAPVPVTRLLNSWTYVNQEDFNLPPNAPDFLEGNPPTWSLIAREGHFHRDIEDLVWEEELLDFATADQPQVQCVRILGPAGYGVTTELMSLAVRVIQEGAGRVFFLRAGATVLEGDVEFVSRIFDEPTFLFIDDAADFAPTLATAFQQLRERRRNLCLVLGDRLNEWRQTRVRLPGSERIIDPLTDGEIDRLLDCLERHSGLGALAELERDVQIAVIRGKHQKQLLVAMKEATEGRAFDAIIESEYRGIVGDLAQEMYAAVSGFYRLKAYMRDDVLATILGRNLADLYQETNVATEGIVILEPIDEARGIYGARTRHHLIAEIVWARCLDPSERQRIMLEGLSALNLNHGVDARAFEALVREDEALAEIGSFEAKVEFFETACRKDPLSPYVRQHYARMLRREKKPALALAQVKAGLDLGPRVRVLYHTKGLVLRDMAMNADSSDMARRRLAQSEEAFQQTIGLGERDDYGYQGLAELYLDWAKRAGSEEETAEYLSKCERTISWGLAKVRVREGLWVVSAKVADWLGDQPAALDALESAVASATAGVYSRYLLARYYLKQGTPKKAIELLKPAIEERPEDHRVYVAYARALHILGKPHSECLAVLGLVNIAGRRDPRYIATYGGLLLLDKQLSASKAVFDEARKRGMPGTELRRLAFRPVDNNGAPLRMVGEVATVRPGFSFIRVAGYGDIFCPGSKYGSLVMTEGLKVEFTLVFSAAGPIVHDPEAV